MIYWTDFHWIFTTW